MTETNIVVSNFKMTGLEPCWSAYPEHLWDDKKPLECWCDPYISFCSEKGLMVIQHRDARKEWVN